RLCTHRRVPRRLPRFFFQAEDGIRPRNVTGVQTCALPISPAQFTAERWFTAIFAVAQHTDVKVVVDGVRFGATDGQIMNKLVEYRRELLGLLSASLSAAKRVFHRL